MAFAANGLLGPTTPTLFTGISNDRSLPNRQLSDAFISDGLTEATNGDQLSFSKSGLLSVEDRVENASSSHKESSASFVINGLLSESQDDYLPEASELLKPYIPLGRVQPRTSSKPSGTSILPSLSIPATTYDGKRLHLRRKTRSHKITETPSNSGQIFAHLLSVPVHRMLDELSAATAAALNGSEAPLERAKNDPLRAEDTLWVDRYRPQRFTDLIGNERVARDVMAWVKRWDFCVFGRRRGQKRGRDDVDDVDSGDDLRRPHEKILLLSGPPGLGKTTLTHVIAQQAGYEVMEINASDARTSQSVEDRIRPALEVGSMVASTKPVLVVIDEIDGATGGEETGFIFKLVQLTLGKPGQKGRYGDKRNKGKRPLRRPIICICNDANAASLAKLRPHAYHVRISRPADTHVVKRLREVCELEGLRADSRALSTLVGVAKGDLRGCLNTLQFVKARGNEVTEPMVRAATRGMKEADSSVISTINDLFAPLTRKRVQELGLSEEGESKYVTRLSREIESAGRESNVAAGCFAHYATLHQHDATLARYEKADDWLVAYDSLSSTMYNDGTYDLYPYLSYMLVPFYPLFKERGAQRIERSQTDWEHFQTTQTNEEIFKSLSHCLRTGSSRHGSDYRHLLTTPILQLEFSPFINRIISPPIRPVNSQVIKSDERALLSRLVSIMVSLELRFVQEKGEDGQLMYRLDPPIDVFITYDGKRASDIAMSRYAVRHLVAGEIDAQLIARQAHAAEKSQIGRGKGPRRGTDENHDGDQEQGPKSKRPRNDTVDICEKPPTDFFGRPILVCSDVGHKQAARKDAVTKAFRVTYEYREGSSAAVRKPVKVATFL